MQDRVTIVLNSVLLFEILIYVYPLKFLFAVVFWSPNSGLPVSVASVEEARSLFMIYGVGFMAIFATLAAPHWHAWRQRDSLDLSAIERFDTRAAILDNVVTAAVGLLSILIALTVPGSRLAFAGWVYALLGLTGASVGMTNGYRRRMLLQKLAARNAAAQT